MCLQPAGSRPMAPICQRRSKPRRIWPVVSSSHRNAAAQNFGWTPPPPRAGIAPKVDRSIGGPVKGLSKLIRVYRILINSR
jgi:hypothetical protein